MAANARPLLNPLFAKSFTRLDFAAVFRRKLPLLNKPLPIILLGLNRKHFPFRRFRFSLVSLFNQAEFSRDALLAGRHSIVGALFGTVYVIIIFKNERSLNTIQLCCWTFYYILNAYYIYRTIKNGELVMPYFYIIHF